MSIIGPISLLSNASVSGPGAWYVCAGYGIVTVEVSGAFSATITVEAQGPSGATYTLDVLPRGTGATGLVTQITSAGLYEIDVAGINAIRLNVTSYTSGSITAKGYAQDIPSRSVGAGGGGSGASFAEIQVASAVSVPASSWWNEPTMDDVRGYARVGYSWTWDNGSAAGQSSNPTIGFYNMAGNSTGLVTPSYGTTSSGSIAQATQAAKSQFQIKNADSAAAHTLNAWCNKFPV